MQLGIALGAYYSGGKGTIVLATLRKRPNFLKLKLPNYPKSCPRARMKQVSLGTTVVIPRTTTTGGRGQL